MPIGNNFNCAISEVIYWKICVQIQVNSNAQFDEFPFLISQIALLASSFGPPTGGEGEARRTEESWQKIFKHPRILQLCQLNMTVVPVAS